MKISGGKVTLEETTTNRVCVPPFCPLWVRFSLELTAFALCADALRSICRGVWKTSVRAHAWKAKCTLTHIAVAFSFRGSATSERKSDDDAVSDPSQDKDLAPPPASASEQPSQTSKQPEGPKVSLQPGISHHR